MSKTVVIILILSICVFAFDEADYPEGTILRPGYDNLQVKQLPVSRDLSLDNYYLENQLVGTPKVMITQYQSGVSLANVQDFVSDFISVNLAGYNIQPEDFRITGNKFLLNKYYFINLVQLHDGVNIWGSNLNIKTTPEGKVFMYGGEIFNNLSVSSTASYSLESARASAISGISYDSASDRIDDSGLFILPLIFDDKIEYHLCYLFNVNVSDPRIDWQIFVDAHNGEVIWRENMIRYETISGNASGLIQLATPYDNEEPGVFPNQYILSNGVWAVTTDSNGNYSFNVAGTQPVDLTSSLQGPFLNVDNQIAQNALFGQSITPGSIVDIFWDDTNSTIPERDAFYHGQVAHDYVKSIDPDLTVMDYSMLCRVNVYGSCNAYWSSHDRSINFFIESGRCPNIAQIADVVYHEYGHGLTHLQYFYGGSSDPNGAMHEGFSDFIACIITDQSLVGRGFFGPGSHLRNLDNDNRYPDDWIGEPHHDGLILGGALWDLKLLIDGDEPGYVDTLWHYAKYGYSGDFENYFWDLLAVDDDDGNIANGTPHAYQIFCSFGDLHGIGPGVSLDIEHTPIIDSEDSTVIFPVEATVTSIFPMDSGSVTLYYSTGGDYVEVELVNLGNNQYYTEIPSQSYGTIVNYYLEVNDNMGLYNTHPEGAPDSVHSFYVGLDLVPPSMELLEGPASTINLNGPYSSFVLWAWDVHKVDSSSAQLHYQINNGSEINVAMLPGSQPGEFYLSELDVGQMLVTGDVINYWFTCRDQALSQNLGRLPESGNFSFDMATSEYIDGFESGIDDWAIIGDGWIHYPNLGHQSYNCIKTGLARYENNMNSIAYHANPFDLSYYNNAWLGFVHLNYFGQGDTCFVVASTSPGGPWTRFDGIADNTNWVETYHELNNFTGPGYEQVYVGFHFISDDSDNNIGIFADDVEIYIAQPTGILTQETLPDDFVLNQNYPNPFNSRTVISFSIPENSPVKLEIYDLLGRKVVKLVDKNLNPGYHQVTWDGKNSSGITVTSGMYFYRLEYDNTTEVKSMVLLK